MANKPTLIAGSYEVKEYLTTKDCAEFIGRSAGAVRNLVLRRAIPHRKPAGRLVFLRSEIEAWIDNAPGKRIEDFKK
jgi:predicted DNA-binding transcriptional regulator AlpA